MDETLISQCYWCTRLVTSDIINRLTLATAHTDPHWLQRPILAHIDVLLLAQFWLQPALAHIGYSPPSWSSTKHVLISIPLYTNIKAPKSSPFSLYETMSNCSQNCWIDWNSAVLFHISFARFVRPIYSHQSSCMGNVVWFQYLRVHELHISLVGQKKASPRQIWRRPMTYDL